MTKLTHSTTDNDLLKQLAMFLLARKPFNMFCSLNLSVYKVHLWLKVAKANKIVSDLIHTIYIYKNNVYIWKMYKACL